MTNNTLPARDVAFLTALADYLLALGADRAADAIFDAIGAEPEDDRPAPVPAPAGEWVEVFSS